MTRMCGVKWEKLESYCDINIRGVGWAFSHYRRPWETFSFQGLKREKITIRDVQEILELKEAHWDFGKLNVWLKALLTCSYSLEEKTLILLLINPHFSLKCDNWHSMAVKMINNTFLGASVLHTIRNSADRCLISFCCKFKKFTHLSDLFDCSKFVTIS